MSLEIKKSMLQWYVIDDFQNGSECRAIFAQAKRKLETTKTCFSRQIMYVEFTEHVRINDVFRM